MPSKRSIEVLRSLRAAERAQNWEDAEIVCDGLDCWMGAERISRQTVTRLIRVVALSFDDGGGAEHYTLNGTGRALAENPALVRDIEAAIARGGAFSVIDGKIVDLEAAEQTHSVR
ncbi:hypothetical protein [Bosea sp. RAC05]|uniref:hypothetical protein n=1 Tax=Bosea sp. RAC05 TaxID=1842539 RepID=UPI00083DCAC3|nr:hypothetical protein [Bosea sp. RAC05]AOG02853.1 hypothetical protein BSY19_4777 [Bosea sp. RAC05]